MKRETLIGILLMISTLVALVWANSPFSGSYFHFWESTLSISLEDVGFSQTLHHWVNDGLMALFFFSVGLELKAELVGGELNSPRKALLPVAAAIGGTLVPIVIFLLFNANNSYSLGWGIPMATDIAFAVVILSLFKNKIAPILLVFLTALAVVDDLCSILVIAIFYTEQTDMHALSIGLISFVVLLGGNRLGIRSPYFYLIIGVMGLWYFFVRSGVHATIAGVLIALAIPARTKTDKQTFAQTAKSLLESFIKSCPSGTVLLTSKQANLMEQARDEIRKAETPLQHWKKRLDPIVDFIVLPLFALANAGIVFSSEAISAFSSTLGIGIVLALWIGKPIGILLSTFIMTKTKVVPLPKGLTLNQLLGAASLAGIGFTVSLFISELAFENPTISDGAKLAVLTASLLSAFSGVLILRRIKISDS